MSLADTTKNLINSLGAVTTVLTRVTQGAYDPTTSTHAAGTTTTYTFNSAPDKVNNSMIDGDNVKFGDMVLYVSPAALSIVPIQNDQITIYTESYLVESVSRINFKGSDALYSCIIRRS